MWSRCIRSKFCCKHSNSGGSNYSVYCRVVGTLATASCVHLQDSLSCKLGAPFIAKAIVTLHWHNAGPAYKPCHELRHKVRGVTLFNCCSKEAAEPWRLASPEFGLKLSSVLLLLSNCFANEAHPGTISKSLCYMCSFLQA